VVGKRSLQAIIHFIAEDILSLLDTLVTNMTRNAGDQDIGFTFIPAAKGTLYFFWIFHIGEENIEIKRKLKNLVYLSQGNPVNNLRYLKFT